MDIQVGRRLLEYLLNPPRSKEIADWEEALSHCLALIEDRDERVVFDLYARSEHLSVYQLDGVNDLLSTGIEIEQVLLALNNKK